MTGGGTFILVSGRASRGGRREEGASTLQACLTSLHTFALVPERRENASGFSAKEHIGGVLRC